MAARANVSAVRAFAPTGMVGTGFSERWFWRALETYEPHFIGADAGSTDQGPYELGAGKPHFPRAACKRDLRLMLLGARRCGVPLLIGSAGTAGGDVHLEWTREIVEEIANEENLDFTLALIHSEQDRDYLKRRLREQRIVPLSPAMPLDEPIIDRSRRIVGMMGTEPYIRALDAGADVVIAGRSSDTSIFAAVPTRLGLPPGPVWHAAKILECGTAAAVHRLAPDGMVATITAGGFEIEPVNPEMACSPVSVAAHNLYENQSPYLLFEPSGVLNTIDARYESVGPRTVKVTGSVFEPAERYNVKLEGVEEAGYQTIVIGSIRDPVIIRQLDAWLAATSEQAASRLEAAGVAEHCAVHFRIYGRNGTLGRYEPITEVRGHELCIVIEVTAPTQALATAGATIIAHSAVHAPVSEWTGLITTLAFPYSPSELERGLVYRFNINHLVLPDDPYEMFPCELIEVGAESQSAKRHGRVASRAGGG